jgi:hypothetical protein
MSDERDDYLVDKRGEPDPDVQRLERLLAPLAHDARRGPPSLEPARGRTALLRAWPWFVAGGAAAAVLVAVSLRVREPEAARPAGPSLTVVGAPTALGERDWVEAQDEARELKLGDVGRVTLSPGARVEVRRLAHDETRLYLERGRLFATVSADARPRFFQVDTPAARCVDLGCRYMLAVDRDGNATVEVQTGQVAFENEGREVYVPAGAKCFATRAHGAGTPFWFDGESELAGAVVAFDEAALLGAEERHARARRLLAATTTVRETLSAWHLLQDRDEAVAAAAHARLVELAGPLPHVPGSAPTSAQERERWKERLAPEW